jgi:hypothetical protein
MSEVRAATRTFVHCRAAQMRGARTFDASCAESLKRKRHALRGALAQLHDDLALGYYRRHRQHEWDPSGIPP